MHEERDVGKEYNMIQTNRTTKKKIQRIRVFIVFILAFLFILAFYHGLVVRNYYVATNKFLPNQSIRIVLIADLHGHLYGGKQEKIATLISKQNPDIILLAGDMADDEVPMKGTELFLEAIQGMAPIYYVTGNHEIWSHKVDKIKNVFRQYGVYVLEHTYEKITVRGIPLIIGGVDDPDIVSYQKLHFHWSDHLLHVFEELEDESVYQILLSHRPEFIDVYKKTSFDLVVSGHSHGGQVRIPFLLNGLYAPNQGWFPPYAGGHYQHETIDHVVSRGVSFNPRLPRIFNPPEIVVIEVTGEKQL